MLKYISAGLKDIFPLFNTEDLNFWKLPRSCAP